MSTAAQIAANQANAQLSTGPRTPEGKAAVSKNAVKHGFCSTHAIVSGEDRGTFEAFREQYRSELRPAGVLEDELLEQIVHAAWNLRRIRIAERALLDDNQWNLDHINKFTRYRRAMQRDFNRALAELKARQADRALREQLEKPALTSLDLARNSPPLALLTKLTKQTQSLRKSYEENDLEAAQEELMSITLVQNEPLARKPLLIST
jgi:hypothetical protein